MESSPETENSWFNWDREEPWTGSTGTDRTDTGTSNPGRKGTSWDVLVVVFDQDAVVSRQHRQVGHGAGTVLVVHTADVSLGRPLDGQRQTTWWNR